MYSKEYVQFLRTVNALHQRRIESLSHQLHAYQNNRPHMVIDALRKELADLQPLIQELQDEVICRNYELQHPPQDTLPDPFQ